MVGLEGYRTGRIKQARLIGTQAVDTLFFKKDGLSLSILKANMLSQCKLGKLGDVETRAVAKGAKPSLGRKQREALLRAISVLIKHKGKFYQKSTWEWNKEENVSFIDCLKSCESKNLMQAFLQTPPSEEELSFAAIVLKKSAVVSNMEECNLYLATDCAQPEQVLLSWIRCVLFIWSSKNEY